MLIEQVLTKPHQKLRSLNQERPSPGQNHSPRIVKRQDDCFTKFRSKNSIYNITEENIKI